MSAFSCGPHRGSEEGVGWNWAVETARLGHEVIALTQTELQGEIEAELASGRLPATLRFEFFMPRWLDRLPDKGHALGLWQPTDHLTHLLWQILAYRYVRPRLAAWRIDLIHHITYSGIRHPTLMGRLPVPLVLGPLGGGERAPMALRRGFGWRGWLIDLVRDLHTWLIRFDPITRRACADALVIYVKTEQSRRALPAAPSRQDRRASRDRHARGRGRAARASRARASRSGSSTPAGSSTGRACISASGASPGCSSAASRRA